MSTPKNYDPGRIVIVGNGVQLQGFAPDTFLKVSRSVDTFTAKAGADGQVVRTKSRNKMGKIELTLLASSSSNDILAGMLAADESSDGFSSAAVGSWMIKDLNGNTLCSATNGWVTKPADIEYAMDSGNRSWVVECDDITIFAGGSVL